MPPARPEAARSRELKGIVTLLGGDGGEPTRARAAGKGKEERATGFLSS